MNGENPVAKASPENASPPAAAAGGDGAATKSRRARALRLDSTAFKLPMTPPPAPQIIDENLEEDDLYVGIHVDAISRIEKLAAFKLARTLYGGVKSQTLLKDLDKLLQEVYESVAIKLNRKLRPKDEEEPERRAARSSAEPDLSTEPDDLLGGPMPLPPDGMSWDEFLAKMQPKPQGGPRPATSDSRSPAAH